VLRFAGILALVFIVAGAIGWLAIQPGDLVAVWHGTRFHTDIATFLVCLGLIVVVAVVIPLAIVRLGRVPSRLRAHRATRRQDRGYAALSDGLVAVAAGDSAGAHRQARAARDLLGEQPLVLLLAAQTAQLDGDDVAAERAFRAMLDRPDTEFLGLRGLTVQALRRGDRQAALPLLDRARALRPKGPWILSSLFELACGVRDWMRAESLAEEMKRAHVIDDAGLRRRRVVLWSARAGDAEAAGRDDEARDLAARANKLDPRFMPAAVVLARRLAAGGDARRAAKVLQTAWTEAPHPALAAAFWTLEPGETPAQRLARTRTLVEAVPDARESRLAVAEQAIGAGDLAAAHAALDPLAREPSARSSALRAVLAQAEHDEAAAREWLARAAQAPRDPVWLCRSCGHDGGMRWDALCPACGGFDSLSWLAPAGVPALASHAISALDVLPEPPPPAPDAPLPQAAPAAAPKPPEAGPAAILPHAPDDPGPDADADFDAGARRR
jgi:HemY protein